LKSLRNRIVLALFIISSLVLIALTIYTGYVMGSTSAVLKQDLSERLLANSTVVAQMVTPAELAQLQTPEDMETPLFNQIRQRLIDYADNQSLLYAYYIRVMPDNMAQFIVDNDLTENASNLGNEPIMIEPAVTVALNGTANVTNLEEYSKGYDGLISAFAPVYNSEGEVVAVAGVDVSDAQIVETNNQSETLTYLLVVSVLLVFISGCANVFLQLRKESQLKRQLEQQELMSTVAQAFVSQVALEELIVATLHMSSDFLNTEHANVLRYTTDTQKPYSIYSWNTKADFASVYALPDLKTIIKTCFPIVPPKDTAVPNIFCNNVSTEYDGTFKEFANMGIKSFVWSPIYSENTLWGILSFAETSKHHVWTDSESQLVNVVSSAINNAINRKVIEEQRQQALDDAVEANQAKSDFLSNMSHEMRTPISAVIGMTTIAKVSGEPKRVNYCLSQIEIASNHLLGIINDVLDMSKIEANKLELANVAFVVKTAIEKATSVMSFKISERKQILNLTIADDIPKIIWGDDQRFTQVIANLLSNANKFTPEGGQIDIEVSSAGEENGTNVIKIAVKDNGIGISEEQQQKLFGSFEQADNSTSRKYGGTGLGLAISKRIVEMMGGHIWLESVAGEGSSFFFTIAAVEAQTSDLSDDEPYLRAQGATSTGAKPGIGGNKTPDLSAFTVLLAEDIDVNQEIVIALLEPTCLKLETASNGIEALEMFKARPEKYDMILMDIQMPEMDGLEASRQIRALAQTANIEHAASVPIVAMTANVFREDVEKSLAAGMNDHLGKPIDVDELIKKLVAFLPTA
jgi:signal transduction histidine kinase/ActR/RegA family two-component response regulator